MRAVKYLPNYTAEQYRQWQGDWELIDGIPYAMSPSPVRKHQRVLSLLDRRIGNWLENNDNCKDCELMLDLDWEVNNNTVVRPDMAITCNDDGNFIGKPPVFIIEIISPSTALNDRQQKFEIYQEQGVKYYVLADPTNKTYNIFFLENGQYSQHNNLTQFDIHENCTLELDLQKIMSELK